jgi:hypothetical protein
MVLKKFVILVELLNQYYIRYYTLYEVYFVYVVLGADTTAVFR